MWRTSSPSSYGTQLRELGAEADPGGAAVPGQRPGDQPVDGEIERVDQRLGQRAGTLARGRG